MMKRRKKIAYENMLKAKNEKVFKDYENTVFFFFLFMLVETLMYSRKDFSFPQSSDDERKRVTGT